MQALGKALCLSAVLATGASASKVAENPLGKVLSLLDGLAAKITAQGAAEDKAFEEFAHWCVDAQRNKGFENQTFTTKKESLEAEIAKQTANAEAADVKVGELASAIAAGTANLKDATAIREKEVADFLANENELIGTIDTLGRAVGIISREMAKNPAAFAQVDTSSLKGMLQSLSVVVEASSFSTADKATLSALLQAQQNAEDDLAEASAPAVASYKSHSSGLLDLLEDLKEKAESQLSDLRKTETNTKHNYEMLKQSIEDQLAADNKDLEEEKAAKAAAEQTKATAQGDLAGTVKDLADAQEALANAQQFCGTTTADHEASVKARNEELKVIAQAKSILESSTGGAVEQAYSFAQVNQASHLGARMQARVDLANAEVVTMVNQLAAKHHSAALAQLASRLQAVIRYGSSAGEDPFVKVRALISDLVTKLEAEAASDATEKDYCDKELKKTETKKAELETDISKLTAKIDQAAAKSASLKAEVVQLQAELATLAQEQAELDKIRKEQNAAYVKAKADLEQGLSGVRQALGVLREYYAAPALVQQPQPAVPGTHSKSGGAGSSIIGILEVAESDFAKSLAREEAQESNAQAEYEKTTQENAVTRTQKEGDVKYKTQEAASLDKTIAELSSDRSTTDNELAAVLEYYAKLKERCIAKPETYEERAQKRADEINGLKEALRTLEQETAFMQRRKRGSSSHFLGA